MDFVDFDFYAWISIFRQTHIHCGRPITPDLHSCININILLCYFSLCLMLYHFWDVYCFVFAICVYLPMSSAQAHVLAIVPSLQPDHDFGIVCQHTSVSLI